MTLAAWQCALDDFEAALRAQREVLSGQGDGPGTFRPPDGLGPLPVELLPRALELARACAELTTQLQLASERTRGSIAQLLPAEAPPGPAFLNTHA